MIGVVKDVIANRNFGFIRGDISGEEYFFHKEDFSGHWDDLAEDIKDKTIKILVEFDAVKSQRGPRASNVKRLDFPNQAA